MDPPTRSGYPKSEGCCCEGSGRFYVFSVPESGSMRCDAPESEHPRPCQRAVVCVCISLVVLTVGLIANGTSRTVRIHSGFYVYCTFREVVELSWPDS